MNVLVIDPHTIYRRGLVAFLESMSEVGDVTHAALPTLTDAHVLIVDPAADPDGRFIREAAHEHGKVVIVCGSDCSPEAISTATGAGAIAHIGKDAHTGDRLAPAIRAAAGRISTPQR